LNAVNATRCLQLTQPSSEGLGSQYVQHGGQRATLGGAREHIKPQGQVAMVQHTSLGISQHWSIWSIPEHLPTVISGYSGLAGLIWWL
jgi:hypothetical protein